MSAVCWVVVVVGGGVRFDCEPDSLVGRPCMYSTYCVQKRAKIKAKREARKGGSEEGGGSAAGTGKKRVDL